MKKSIIILVLIVVGILLLTTVTGLIVTALMAEKINLFGGSIQDTDFSVTSIETQFKGKNKIVINLEITNNDDVAGHSGNLSVQLLDVSGDILLEHSVLLGVVAPSGTYGYNHDFVFNGVVELYNSNYIVIKQID